MIVARARRRLTLINVGAMAVLVLVLGGGIVTVLDWILMAQETSNVTNEAALAAVEFSELSESGFQERHRSYSAGTFYVVWSTAGNAVFNPANVDTRPLRASAVAALAGHSATGPISLPGQEDALVASQLLMEDSNPVGALQVGHSLAPLHRFETEAVVVVALSSGAALLMSLLAAWFVAGRALVPIRDALERQRSFTADASHELRSPLTVIDTGIQVLRRHPEKTIADSDDVLGSMQEESRRMGRMLGGLLALARADSGEAQLQITDVDVAELVRAALRDLEPLAATRGCTIETSGVDLVTAQVDADRFKQLIVILVDNAVKHGPPGGAVEVRCTRHDRSLVLEVADHGPGIPADQRDRVFERFHRLDSSRNGSGAGLGLSIARWIVTSHGGSISLHDNHPGLRISVSLPLMNRSPQDGRPPRSGLRRDA